MVIFPRETSKTALAEVAEMEKAENTEKAKNDIIFLRIVENQSNPGRTAPS